MRRIFLLMGLALGVLATAGLIYFNIANAPVVTRIPVASRDIPAGTTLSESDFRVVSWSDVDAQSLGRYVTLAEFGKYAGAVVLSDVRAGFPVGKSQIDPDAPSGIESRLSVAITGTRSYYVVLPASPDQIGNWVQPNDRVDMLVTIGAAPSNGAFAIAPTPDPNADPLADPAALALTPPTTKLVLQNLRIVRIDRERDVDAPSAGASSPTARFRADDGDPELAAPVDLADVKRIYVEVSQEQLEVLTFVKRNGQHDFAVRAATNAEVLPTEGVAFDDYARWFFAQRGGQMPADAKPFEGAGPYAPQENR
jgi:Flp pilus assembly protein CpaB